MCGCKKGIQKDAGKLLKDIYGKYEKGALEIGTTEVIDWTKWEATRIDNAIDCLRDLGVLRIRLDAGNTDGLKNFHINGLNSLGIAIITNKEKFKETFGFDLE